MAATDRLARAKELRERRSAGRKGGNPNVKRIEVSGNTTFAAIFFLLCIGASLATSYIMTHNPGCLTANPTTTTTSTTDATSNNNNLRTSAATGAAVVATTPAAAPATTTTTAAAAAAPSKPGFPPKCTDAQMLILRKQLSASKCFDQPYTQTCSFTQATTRPVDKCFDTPWVREVYGKMKVPKFNALFINNLCGKIETLMDVMAIGSHDPNKFNRNKFMGGNIEPNCRKEILMEAAQPAMGVCINKDAGVISTVQAARTSAGLSTDELKDVTSQLGITNSGTTKTLDKVVEEVGLKDQPIHALIMKAEDCNVLRGAWNTLDQLRYIEFEYHWQGAWISGSLGEIVKRLMKDKNFVCYWNGYTNGLWRITDCWQPHYSQKWWSQIACVSAVHEESKPILEKMEETFLATLQKSKVYGG